MTSQGFPFPEGLKGSPNLHKTSTPYAALQPSEQADLLLITHFVHVHHQYLKLSPYELLTSVEESILSRRGRAYEQLIARIPTKVGENEYLASLRHGVDELASTGKFREACMIGHCINHHNVHPCARPMSVNDSRGVKYLWIRGCAGVSTRFLAGDKVLGDPIGFAEYLRRRGGRKDVFVAGWMVSRVESAERKAVGVRQEHEKEVVRRELAEERERGRRAERARRVERLGDMGGVVEGGRKRREVRYVESEDDDDDDESADDESADEETGDEEFEICEEVLDGGSAEDSCESRDVESEDDVVVGRVRVQVSARAQRAARRAGTIGGNGKTLRSGRVMGKGG